MELLRQVQIHQDDSVTRPDIDRPPFFVPASSSDPVPSIDVTLDPLSGLWARVYNPPNPAGKLLPVIVYVHGGGFCFLSPGTMEYHRFTTRLASETSSVVFSLAYRLTPEHRLPAAYDDLRTALRWLSSPEARHHLPESADLSRLFLIGDSAGGNIIHNVLASGDPIEPQGLRGVVLLQPYYAGEERTESEKESDEQGFLTVALSEACWKLALPVTDPPATRDHPFCSPSATGLPDVGVMLVVGGRDVLRDRDLRVAAELETLGRRAVELHVFEEEEHAFYARRLDSDAVKKLMGLIYAFITRFVGV